MVKPGPVQLLRRDRWAMPAVRQHTGLLTAVLAFGALTVLSGSALMFTSGYLISKSATHPYNLLAVYVPVVLTRAFGIGRPTFRYLERLVSHDWVLRMTSGLRRKLYQTLEGDAAFFKQRHRTGDMLGLLADDIDHLQNMYLLTIFPSLIAGLVALTVVIAFGLVTPLFGLGLGLVLAGSLIVAPWLSLRLDRSRKLHQKRLQAAGYRQLTDAVLGAADWMIAGRQQAVVAASARQADRLSRSVQTGKRFSLRRDYTLQLLFGLTCAAVILWAAHVFGGDPGRANWIAAWALCLFPLFESFLAVNRGVTDWPVYETSLHRLNDLQPETAIMPAQQPPPRNWERLHVRELTFGYDSRPVIRQLNLTIRRGSTVAILGRSGSGKSTLLKLLMGDLAAQQGSVQLDETGIRSLHDHQAKLFGMLDQHPFLFNTSIINNVRLGNPQASDRAVNQALRRVGLSRLISGLPDGYDTVVEDGGGRFSGGEQQRIALARMLLQNAPIILLDEPTVGLDPITEQALLKTIFSVFADKTIIWVTHHLAGIEQADQLIVMENGEVRLQGTARQLYDTSAAFRRLYQLDHADY